MLTSFDLVGTSTAMRRRFLGGKGQVWATEFGCNRFFGFCSSSSLRWCDSASGLFCNWLATSSRACSSATHSELSVLFSFSCSSLLSECLMWTKAPTSSSSLSSYSSLSSPLRLLLSRERRPFTGTGTPGVMCFLRNSSSSLR